MRTSAGGFCDWYVWSVRLARITIDDRPFQRLAARFDEIGRDAIKEARKAAQKAAVEVQGRAVEGINNGPATGKPRPLKNRVASSRSSNPGEYPMADRGTLAQSIRVEPRTNGADVVAGAKHAIFLEFGTDYMEPRPFLSAALRDKEDEIAEIYADAMRDALRD